MPEKITEKRPKTDIFDIFSIIGQCLYLIGLSNRYACPLQVPSAVPHFPVFFRFFFCLQDSIAAFMCFCFLVYVRPVKFGKQCLPYSLAMYRPESSRTPKTSQRYHPDIQTPLTPEDQHKGQQNTPKRRFLFFGHVLGRHLKWEQTKYTTKNHIKLLKAAWTRQTAGVGQAIIINNTFSIFAHLLSWEVQGFEYLETSAILVGNH